jgi:hypothetical protein
VKRSSRRLLALGLMGIVTSGVLAGEAPASADAIPFTDPSANGSIGFCNPAGKSVTSGNINDIPFVWKAVSSTPTPAGYVGGFGKATLEVFQPRKDVDPGNWSGKQLTGSTTYSNAQHPVAQATYGDPSLGDFVEVAPSWDNLYQIRLYFSNINTPPDNTNYPATVIKVAGSTWTVVSGASVPCNAGAGKSIETIALPPSSIPSSPPPTVSHGVTATTSPTSSSSVSGTSSGSGGSSPAGSPTGPSPSSATAQAAAGLPPSSGSTGSSSTPGRVAVALALLVLAGFGVSAVVWRRGRSASPGGTA